MTWLAYAVIAYAALWPASWAVAFIAGWCCGRRGMSELSFSVELERFEGIARRCAIAGYDLGREQPGGFAGMGGGAGI